MTTYNLVVNGKSYPIRYEILGDTNLVNMTADVAKASLLIYIDSQSNGTLFVELPRKVIDSRGQGNVDKDYIVFANGTSIVADETLSNDLLRALTINFPVGREQIRIQGTKLGEITSTSEEIAITRSRNETIQSNFTNQSMVPPKENQTINFLTYEDPFDEYRIDYPSDWQKLNQTDKSSDILFKSPLENSDDTFQETVGLRVVSLSRNMTLTEFTNTNIDSLKQSANVLDSTPVTLADKPAYRIVYLTNENSQVMQAWTLVGNKVYLITYVSEPSKYLDSLPTVQKVIDSFAVDVSREGKADETINMAENKTETDKISSFLTFENPTYGFRMQYPSDWEKIELNKKGMTNLILQFRGPEARFDVTTLDKKYSDIDGLFNERLNMYNVSGFQIAKSEISPHVAGYPAYTIKADGGSSTITEYGMIPGDESYVLSWETSNSLDYNQLLQVAQEVIDSFEIIAPSGTNTATNRGQQQQEQQPTGTPGFLTYKDIVNRVTVQYPQTWQKQENVYGTHGVQFSPTATDRDNVLIDVLTEPGLTLDSWTQEKLASIRSREGSQIIQSSPTTLSGNPAYEVTYLWEGDKIMELWTAVGDRLYAISYVAVGEEKFQTYLPLVKMVVDSFEIGSATDTNASQNIQELPQGPKGTTTGKSELNDTQHAERGSTAADQAQIKQTYVDPEGRFSLDHPAGWEVKERENRFEPTDLILIDPMNFIALSIKIAPNVVNASDVDSMKLITHLDLLDLRNQFPDLNVLEPIECKKYRIDGKNTCSVSYTAMLQETREKGAFLQIMVVDEDKQNGYTIKYVTIADERFDKFLPEIQKMMKSIRFLP